MYNLSDWKKQFLSGHVQSQSIKGADFLSSETVVLVSGPAELDESKAADLVPIGLVQNVQVAQQKQIQQIYEIGSRKPFFIPGRTIVSAGISRVLFDGPSLMYSMYLSGQAAGAGPTMPAYLKDGVAGTELPTSPVTAFSAAIADDEATNAVANSVNFRTSSTKADPGYLFINLASGFFNRPLGLGFMFYDGEQDVYGGFYLEGCYIQSHQFNVAAQQTILVENVSLRCTAMRPIDADSIKFSTTETAGTGGNNGGGTTNG